MTDIPIFPLGSVLFPGARISLRIFERRYRELIARCLEDGSGFGIVLIRSGNEVGDHAEPFDTGVIARIVHAERFADGQYAIEVEGRERFRIRSVDITSRPYQVATVETLAETDGTQPAEVEKIERDFDEAARLVRTLAGSWSEMSVLPSSPVEVMYYIASRLRMDEREKLEILVAEDARTRAMLLGPHVERLTSALTTQVRAFRDSRLRGFGSTN